MLWNMKLITFLVLVLIPYRKGCWSFLISSSSLPGQQRANRRSSSTFFLVSSTPSTSASTTATATATTTRRAAPPRLPDTSVPLSRSTFAGLVEQALLERYPEHDIQRILTSWRLLDQDYFHQEYVGTYKQKKKAEVDRAGEDGDNDQQLQHEHELERAAPDMVQECHSYVPGLQIEPFWDTKQFGWSNYLEAHYPEIKKEFLAMNQQLVHEQQHQQQQQRGNNIWAGAITDEAAAYGTGWTTLALMDRGRWDAENVQLFPITAQAVRDSGCPCTEVFFAKLDGPSTIQKHTDFTNFVLTSHLGLDIPGDGTNQCRLSVGDTTRQWRNGQVLVFDTSLVHDAVNDTDEPRYILMLRLWHPSLSVIEQQALQFTFDCLEYPELLDATTTSDDPATIRHRVEATREFPKIVSTNAARPTQQQGFGGGGGGGMKGGGGGKGNNKKGKQKKKKGGRKR